MCSFAGIVSVFLCIHFSSSFTPSLTRYPPKVRKWPSTDLALGRTSGGNKEIIETQSDRNAVYKLLSNPRDEKPGQCNFFYNDEVMSHLHGYMLLVGLFAACDPTFLAAFVATAGVAAGCTLAGLLPANPRVPAIVALLTLIITCLCRYGIGYEHIPFVAELNYPTPTEEALLYEILVCSINMTWGFLGSWRTKERINGATFGF